MLEHLLPRVLAADWQRVICPVIGGAAYARGNTRVIVSLEVEADGRQWLHVSASKPMRVPSWDDMREVKDLFIGRDREAYQVMPPADRYVNTHPYCLHLWSCLDGPVLPDFRKEGQI